MKYCMNYNQKTEHMKCLTEADEWTIEYNSRDTTLLEFLEIHKDIRINLHITEKVDITFLEDLAKKFPNLYFELSINFLDDIVEKKPKFNYFFDILVNNWDTFIGLIYKGITDIYIVENMGFELDKIAEMAHKENISIRTFPNVAQSAWKGIVSLKKFFIRPEDVEVYEPYVDTFEFFGDDSRLETYYKIYAKDKKWFGLLKELIIDFNSDIDNKYVIPRFAEKRISCGKKCFKGGKCSRCNRIQELSESLEKSKLIVRVDNDKVDKN